MLLFPCVLFGQQYADQEYYLVDSLVLTSLSESDHQLVDSCLALYHNAKQDTDKVNALKGICENMMDESWHKYQYSQHQLIETLLSSHPPSGTKMSLLSSLADALNNIGYINMGHGDMEKALDYYHRSLKIHEEIGEKEGIAISLNNIGMIYKGQGDIKKALDYYHRSLNIYEDVGKKEGLASTLSNLGVIYNDQGDTEKALEYYHRSLKIREELGKKEGIAISLNNIGFIYKSQGDIKKALDYYHRSLRIKEELGYKKGIAISLNNIGLIYNGQGDIENALDYYRRSLTMREELGYKEGIATCLNNIGSAELELGEFSAGKKHLEEGLKLAREVGSPSLISSNSAELSSLFKQQGKHKEALEMYELHIQMRDSIKNEETQKATIRQQTKYEFEKAQLVKEQEEKEVRRKTIEVRQRRDNLQYSVILIALLVIGGLLSVIGRFSMSIRVVEGLIFFSFLILFEFLLVLADPYIEEWSGGAPGIKLLFNAGIAALIFPAHAFFESRLKGMLVK